MVITLLSMLFVIGVAFLASMNFEADIIQAERLRKNKESSVTEVFDGFTDQLRDSLMAGTKEPFGTDSPKDSIAGYAQLPIWHNLSSPIEPYQRVGGQINFRWHTDLRGLYNKNLQCVGGSSAGLPCISSIGCPGGYCSDNFNGPHLPPGPGFDGFEIDTSMVNGAVINNVCIGGNDKGLSCFANADCDSSFCGSVQQCVGGDSDGLDCSTGCLGGYCSGQVVVDADGDGIVDTVQVDASLMGFTKRQLVELSKTVNGRPDGKVFVGLRIIPHSGLVNLNESHPNLIQNVFNLANWPVQGDATDPALEFFSHTPTQDEVGYSTFIEERVLRRRGGLLPPNSIPPSTLYGNQFLQEQDTTSDMLAQLLPPGQKLLDHRFWLFEPDEMLGSNPNVLAWAMRMEPVYSADNDTNFINNAALNEYDQSHLVTTVSYDDLLSRGGRVSLNGEALDIRDAMRQANFEAYSPGEGCLALLPFEYADYPHTIDNNFSNLEQMTCCATQKEKECEPNIRKGRLQLSLSWLDENFFNGVISLEEMTRLIYDTFWMLVRNASGEYWGTVECRSDSECAGNLRCDLHDLTCQQANCPTDACPVGQICDTTKSICYTPCGNNAACEPGPFVCEAGRCIDPWTHQSRREALVSRTAASLTANMLDYFDPLQCVGGINANFPCIDDTDCPSGTCQNIPTRVAIRSFDFFDTYTAGRDKNLSLITTSLPDPTYKYVYGLEQQPFISEVMTFADDTTQNLLSWAIEIINPYDRDLNTNSEYLLQVANKKDVLQPPITLNPTISANEFTVFKNDAGNNFQIATGAGLNGTIYDLPSFSFKHGWTIYLIHRYTFPGDTTPTDIVVDQILVEKNCIGLEMIELDTAGCVTPYSYAMRRHVPNSNAKWTVSVPIYDELTFDPILQSAVVFANWNDLGIGFKHHPVELNPANTGSFTQFDPTNPAPGAAFPTTGSMLMLLRHANRSLADYKLPVPMGTPTITTVPDLAFTTWLDDTTQVADPKSGAVWATIREDQLIDNGRMPVFDRLFTETLILSNKHAAHHVAHNARVNDTNIPGDIKNLPWGQLVFDYFTVLPLDNRGPYRTYLDTDLVGEPHSQPRVDMDGLRVHGRIDINAAPLKVLEGLPLIPMERIPQAYRARFGTALGITSLTQAEILNATMAFGMIAYREAREGEPTTPGGITGDYGSTNNFGRAWDQKNISFRRGSGFLTVGELANIRYDNGRACNGGVNNGKTCTAINAFLDCPNGTCDAINKNSRMDSGKVAATADGADYVEAIARIAALGDWVTVRSHVHTIYGVVRGEIDQSITDPTNLDREERLQKEDVEARSIRFQDTVDRLPTFLGQPAPVSLGERVIGKYRDIHNN